MKSLYFRYLSSILALFLFCFVSKTESKDLDYDAYYLIGKQAQYTPEAFIQGTLKDSVQYSKKRVLSLGHYKPGTLLWLDIQLHTPFTGNAVVSFGKAVTDSIEVFFYNGNTLLSSAKTGDGFAFDQRYFPHNFPNLALPPSTDRLIIKITTNGALIVPFELVSVKTLFERYNFQDIISFVYFGFVIFVIVANLFLFLWLRESIYLYYLLGTIASGFCIAVEFGYTFRFLWPDMPELNTYAPAYLCSLVLVALFSEKFLSLREKAPFLSHLYKLVYLLFFITFLLAITGEYYYSVVLLNSTAGLILPLVSLFASSYIYIKYNQKETGFFIIAWTGCFIMLILYALMIRGIVPYNTFTDNSIIAGSATELLFFFLAVVNKIETLRKEKEGILSLQNKLLEERVEERTDELQKKNEEILTQNELIEHQNLLLRNTKVSLEKQVEDQTRTLLDVNKELLEKNSRLEQFAYVSAHNLRGPVATLMGLINLYDQKQPDLPDNQLVITKSAETIQKLDSILKDLSSVLDQTSIDRKFMEEINLEGVLRECKKTLRDEIEKTKAEIRTNFSPHTTLRAIPLYIQNIFYHLLSNAIRYTDPRVPPVVTIHYEKTPSLSRLTFTDNGLGMDVEKVQQNLFRPFRKFHNISGRGLGLYIIKRQIDSMNGRIFLKSQLKKGTEITIEFDHFENTTEAAPIT
jgi:signal transduction histidine kinase